MEMKSVITKSIVSSDNKEFEIKDDINFILCRNNKEYKCFGVIVDIYENSFKIEDVVIDGMNLSQYLTVEFDEVKDSIIKRSDNGWY